MARVENLGDHLDFKYGWKQRLTESEHDGNNFKCSGLFEFVDPYKIYAVSFLDLLGRVNKVYTIFIGSCKSPRDFTHPPNQAILRHFHTLSILNRMSVKLRFVRSR